MFDADKTRMIGLPYGKKNYDTNGTVQAPEKCLIHEVYQPTDRIVYTAVVHLKL